MAQDSVGPERDRRLINWLMRDNHSSYSSGPCPASVPEAPASR
jgi:hypothetical protein